MKILFTGVSSFTGFWFARTLASAGHEVVATLTKPVASYAELRSRRLVELAPSVKFAPEVRFGTPTFRDLIEREGPCDVLCHHAADVTDYNSPDFDTVAALANNTAGLKSTLEAFRAAGGRAVVLTGSVFEADEGSGDEPRRAFNPYGLSKTLTAAMFSHYVPAAGLRWGKFVIPNPFGPWEEPRFTAYLIRTWRDRKVAEVKTPDYVRDNVPVDLLAHCYRGFVEQVAGSDAAFARLSPSLFSESQGVFAGRFAREMRGRLHLPCELLLGHQVDFSQPMIRVNTDSARSLIPHWVERESWDRCADYYSRTYQL